MPHLYAGSFDSAPPPVAPARAQYQPAQYQPAPGPAAHPEPPVWAPAAAGTPHSGGSTGPSRRLLIALAAIGVGGVALGVILVGSLMFLGKGANYRYEPVGGQRGGVVEVGRPPTTESNLIYEPIAAVEEVCQQARNAPAPGDQRFPELDPGGVGQFGQVVQLYEDGQSEWMATVDLVDGNRAVPAPLSSTEWGDGTAQATAVAVCAMPPEVLPGEPLVCVFNAPVADGTVPEHRVNRWGTSMEIHVLRMRDGRSIEHPRDHHSGVVRSRPGAGPTGGALSRADLGGDVGSKPPVRRGRRVGRRSSGPSRAGQVGRFSANASGSPPPCSTTLAPLMNDASGEARKATTSPTSAGSASRPIGTVAAAALAPCAPP